MENRPTDTSDAWLAKRLYVLISIMLALPALALPLSFGRVQVEVVDWTSPVELWRLSLVCLTLVASVADNLIGATMARRDVILAALWITVSYSQVFLAVQLPFRLGVYMLGCLLVALAARSAWQLWSGRTDWWLWPAWLRDSLAAFSVFAWFA